MKTDITELAPAMKAAAELITSGYSRKWIVSHDDETCWVGANDDDGNLTPFIEVSIADWSGNKVDNETLARFISLCRPANVIALVEALEKAQTKIIELQQKAEIDPRTHEIIDLKERIIETNDVLCNLLPDCRYMDPPDGGSVTPLEQVSRMIADYRQRIAELESRTVTVKLPKLKMLEDYLAEVAIEERKQILVGVKLEFHRELAAAGIKVEAE